MVLMRRAFSDQAASGSSIMKEPYPDGQQGLLPERLTQL